MNAQVIKAERAAQRAGALPYAPGPHAPGYYSVRHRNAGHWDVLAPRRPGYVQWWLDQNPGSYATPPVKEGELERAYRVRGAPPRVLVLDERWDPERPHPRAPLEFATVMGAMTYVTQTLMLEPEL